LSVFMPSSGENLRSNATSTALSALMNARP
jgi:hypothetical protein